MLSREREREPRLFRYTVSCLFYEHPYRYKVDHSFCHLTVRRKNYFFPSSITFRKNGIISLIRSVLIYDGSKVTDEI